MYPRDTCAIDASGATTARVFMVRRILINFLSVIPLHTSIALHATPRTHANRHTHTVALMDALLFDPSTIHFGIPITQNNGQKIIPLSTVANQFEYNTRIRLQLGKDQEHMLHTEYGVSKPYPGADPNRTNMDVLLSEELVAQFNKLDEVVAKNMAENCQAYFKTPTLTKQQMTTVRYNKDGKPIIRIKVNQGDKNPSEVRILKGNTTFIRPASEIRRADIIVVMDTPGVWSNATQFGTSFTMRGCIARMSSGVPTGLNMFTLKPGITDGEPQTVDVSMDPMVDDE